MIKRPIVCKSKTIPGEPAHWPGILNADVTWLILHGTDTLSSFAGTIAFAHIGESNEYALLFQDAEGSACVLTAFLGFLGTPSTALLEITTGPAAGTTAAAQTTGWNGEAMWRSSAGNLLFSDPLGTGTIELWTP